MANLCKMTPAGYPTFQPHAYGDLGTCVYCGADKPKAEITIEADRIALVRFPNGKSLRILAEESGYVELQTVDAGVHLEGYAHSKTEFHISVEDNGRKK